MLSESDIARIANRVGAAYAPLAVGIFGSYAVGLARERSDLDLFVIKDTPEKPEARARAVRRMLFGLLHPVDIHVFTPSEFEDTVYEELSFAWVIVRQARLYYRAPGLTWRVPSLGIERRLPALEESDGPSLTQNPE